MKSINSQKEYLKPSAEKGSELFSNGGGHMLIKNWKELSQIPNESPTHRLEVNVNIGYAWLYAKNKKDFTNKLSFMRQIHNQDVYLSTHTFYGEMHRRSTKILKACGFNVEIDNWDKDK